MSESLTIAMVREVFAGSEAGARLQARLVEAREAGASLAVLPELPLNPWRLHSRQPEDDDAEPRGGPRHRLLAQAAAASGVAVLGGAIVRGDDGRRRNEALLYDRSGALIATYGKLHLPAEEGFWESSHYEPADAPPRAIAFGGFPVGIQICSDLNRPEGTHLLGAQGALALLAPRATEATTWERWKLVLRGNAITSALWVLTVPRPAPENGVPLGGPAAAISPSGDVVLETEEPVSVVRVDRAAVEAARRAYPGYLDLRASTYADGWAEVARASRDKVAP